MELFEALVLTNMLFTVVLIGTVVHWWTKMSFLEKMVQQQKLVQQMKKQPSHGFSPFLSDSNSGARAVTSSEKSPSYLG